MNTKTKNYRINQKNQRKSHKKLLVLSLVVGLIVVGVIGYFLYNKKGNDPVANNEVETTSTAETAQSDYSSGDDKSLNEADTDKGDAVVADNQGSIAQTPDESSWTTSSTNQITLYSPSQSQLIKNGDSITGESSLSAVSFRVIDSVSGVISTGQLSVVNGKFSGSISFSTTASEGRLDIFGTKDDGGEFSNIEIPVRFK